MFGCELLRDHAPEREADDIELGQAHRTTECGAVFCQRCNGRRRFAGRLTDPGVVEDDDIMLRG